MKTLQFLALSVAGVGMLGACGSSSSSSSAPSAAGAAASATTVASSGGATTAAAASNVITVKNFAFSAAKVAPSAKVTVKNEDTAKHTMTADDKSFDVAIGAGASASLTAPAKAGSYAFHCSIHSSMKGTLVVEG